MKSKSRIVADKKLLTLVVCKEWAGKGESPVNGGQEEKKADSNCRRGK